MNDFDNLIKETLSKEDADFLQGMEEDSLFQQMTSNFKGKLGWVSIYALIMTLVFFGLSIYAAIQFFDASGTKELLMWATIFMFSVLTMSLLKTWQWLQMDKNRILREIKRLELQISLLAKK